MPPTRPARRSTSPRGMCHSSPSSTHTDSLQTWLPLSDEQTHAHSTTSRHRHPQNRRPRPPAQRHLQQRHLSSHPQLMTPPVVHPITKRDPRPTFPVPPMPLYSSVPTSSATDELTYRQPAHFPMSPLPPSPPSSA